MRSVGVVARHAWWPRNGEGQGVGAGVWSFYVAGPSCCVCCGGVVW